MKKKVLIIEDDPIVGHIYQTRLEREDYEVQICTDGQSGFYAIHEFHPDSVLLDLMLPKMNGVDILKKIRAQSQFHKVPIIVFTNAYVPNMIHESFQAGATQVFNKATLTPRQIIEALNTALFLSATNTTKPAAGSVAPANSSQAVDPNQAANLKASALGDAPFHAEPPRSGGAPEVVQPLPNSAPASTAADATTPGVTPPAEDASAVDTSSFDDDEFQTELRRTFMETAPDTLGTLRKVMQDFGKAQDENARLLQLMEVYRKVHGLTGNAGLAGLTSISQMAAALEILLKELYEKPKNINASTLRTVASSIDFIGELFSRGERAEVLDGAPVNILVVDDEILSRRAITYALEKAGLKSVSVEEPQNALQLASESTFDLIFLDVQMPGMDGFELCTKIRSLPSNKTTPVIFVTSLTDFKSRARSTLSGGTDLIAKPFMFIELSVKALTYVLRGRLKQADQAVAAGTGL